MEIIREKNCRIPQVHQMANPVSFAVARGTTQPSAAGRPTASGSSPSVGATFSGSGLSAFLVSRVSYESESEIEAIGAPSAEQVTGCLVP